MRSYYVFLLLATSAGAQTITSVSNAASYIPPGIASSGIAQGSMFVIKGTGLGPGTFAVATTFPLPTAIGGTSVRISAGGTTADAIMYYAGGTQIAAILPSSTPTGAATLTVTANGRASSPFSFQIVRNALGVFTIPQSGMGEAIATSADRFVGPLNAVNPGDIVSFWGTGLGPVTGNEANAAVQADLATIPLEAYIGGKQAEVLFRGRNGCCSAVDTVYIKIPEGVSGCATSVMFKIGEVRSNTTTIAVAASGRTCTPVDPSLDITRLNPLVTKPSLGIGEIVLSRQRSVNTPRQLSSRSDFGSAIFHKVTTAGGLGLGPALDIPSPGSCIIDTYPANNVPVPLFNSTTLDAGPSLPMTTPAGQRPLLWDLIAGVTSYKSSLGTAEFFVDGRLTVTGPGDPAATANSVGAFTAQVDMPARLVWTNQSAITTVNRSQGVTVNWTGGGNYKLVRIQATTGSSANLRESIAVGVTCTALAADGTFTIPPAVLMALPATPSSVSGTLSVEGIVASPFSAPGVDFGRIYATDWNGAIVTYQ